MAVSRKRKARRGRPRTLGPTLKPKNVALSLPPAPVDETPQTASTTPEPAPERWAERPPLGHPDRNWWLPDNSSVKPKAMMIIALRLQGRDDDQIATELGISKNSISPYVYRATKNGWLDIDYDPKERVQFQVMHKIVQRLEEGLDDKHRNEKTGMTVATTVALKMAEGTLFKQFDQQAAPQQAQTVVAVQVVMPEGPVQTIRAETTGGVPAYMDAVVES